MPLFPSPPVPDKFGFKRTQPATKTQFELFLKDELEEKYVKEPQDNSATTSKDSIKDDSSTSRKSFALRRSKEEKDDKKEQKKDSKKDLKKEEKEAKKEQKKEKEKKRVSKSFSMQQLRKTLPKSSGDLDRWLEAIKLVTTDVATNKTQKFTTIMKLMKSMNNALNNPRALSYDGGSDDEDEKDKKRFRGNRGQRELVKEIKQMREQIKTLTECAQQHYSNMQIEMQDMRKRFGVVLLLVFCIFFWFWRY